MMKNLSILVLLVLSLSGVSIGQDISSEITSAFKAGNSKVLAQYMGENLDLTVQDSEGIYSKAQAELILKSFFTKNKPKSFSIMHQGTSKTSMHYAIGELVSDKNKRFRVSFYMKSSGDKELIQNLSIDPES